MLGKCTLASAPDHPGHGTGSRSHSVPRERKIVVYSSMYFLCFGLVVGLLLGILYSQEKGIGRFGKNNKCFIPCDRMSEFVNLIETTRQHTGTRNIMNNDEYFLG